MKRTILPAYQPIVDITTGLASHYEALARITRDCGSHHDLIELAEHFRFIDLVDSAVLEHAVAALSHTTPDMRVAVNVSMATLTDACGEYLSVLFRHMDIVPRLVFEMTETVSGERSRVDRFVAAVRLAGGQIAIDDYGTGHHTFAMIRAIKPDFLKLSERITDDLVGRAPLVERVRDLLAPFGGEIIAEHVDTLEKLRALQALHVRYGQGFLFDKPSSQLPLTPQLYSLVAEPLPDHPVMEASHV